jgi:hypothetical protein
LSKIAKPSPLRYAWTKEFHPGSSRFGGRGGHENNIDPGGSRDWEAVEVTEVTNTKVEAVEAEKAMKITLTQEVAERPWKSQMSQIPKWRRRRLLRPRRP